MRSWWVEVEVARRKEAALAVVRARLPKRKLKEVRWLVDCGEKNGRVGLALSTGTHTHTQKKKAPGFVHRDPQV